jgi:hypothetical protein
MKHFIILLILFSSISSFSQEIILPGGDQDDILNAISTLNGSGTITIKGDITINSPVTIPNGITLNFFTGNKLNIINTNPQVIIKGNIVASLNQIFNISNSNYTFEILNQEIYPEWFGKMSYQFGLTTSLIDDVSAIKKAIIAIDGKGTIVFKGSSYSIKSDIDVDYGITLDFINSSKWVIDSQTNPYVNLKGTIQSKNHQVFETTVNHNLTIYNQSVYPEWFGVCEYQKYENFRGFYKNQSNLDSDYIQMAIDASDYGGIIILNGKYYTIDKEIKVNVGKLRISGRKVRYSPFEGPTNNIMVMNDNLNVIFNITANGVTFSGLNFTGYNGSNIYENKGAGTRGIALNYIREPDGVKDLDATVRDCIFLGFRNCIYGEGTNLKIIDNNFVASYIGVYLNEAHTNDDPVIVDPQFRGHVIDRNRFHSIGSYKKDQSLEGSTCIKIWGTQGVTFDDNFNYGQDYTVRGYYNQITNNYADDCKTFFEGSVDRTKIDNNSILTSGGTAIKAFGGTYGSITNNIIDGSFTWNPKRLFYYLDSPSQDFPSGYGIQVRFANFITIHNNQILNKRYHGIYIEKSHNSSIQLNTILNFNRHRFVKIDSSPGDTGLRNQDYLPHTNDSIKGMYSGIYIMRTDIVANSNPPHRYNIQNVISNNTINIPHTYVEGKYGIYVGDGDAWNLVTDNFITAYRMVQDIKIETP